jgi:hypothetical protein
MRRKFEEFGECLRKLEEKMSGKCGRLYEVPPHPSS